jgi:hypothetical protein
VGALFFLDCLLFLLLSFLLHFTDTHSPFHSFPLRRELWQWRARRLPFPALSLLLEAYQRLQAHSTASLSLFFFFFDDLFLKISFDHCALERSLSIVMGTGCSHPVTPRVSRAGEHDVVRSASCRYNVMSV